MINRLDITDEYSAKCDFILNTVTFIDAALNISLRKLWKCNVLWFYLFGQGVPNETKGTINLKTEATSKILNNENLYSGQLSIPAKFCIPIRLVRLYICHILS